MGENPTPGSLNCAGSWSDVPEAEMKAIWESIDELGGELPNLWIKATLNVVDSTFLISFLRNNHARAVGCSLPHPITPMRTVSKESKLLY